MLNIYEQEINSIEIPMAKKEKLLNQKAKKAREAIFGLLIRCEPVDGDVSRLLKSLMPVKRQTQKRTKIFFFPSRAW